MLPPEITVLLTPPPEGLLLVVTVGNTLRGDDGVGPRIAELASQPRTGIHILNVGEHPENCLDEEVCHGASRIVIIDAADFGGAPGEVRQLKTEDLHHALLSTHSFPLAAIARLLSDDTGAEVYFLGVQALDVSLGAGLSLEVAATAKVMAGFLV